MPPTRREFLGTLAAAPLLAASPTDARLRPVPAQANAARLVVVSLDGVRIQEMFGGLDRDLLQSVIGKQDVEAHPLFKAYWRPTAEARRRALMPFLWDELFVRHGSVVGNPAAGSAMRLGNRHRFSYPGYAELMLGVAHDDEIRSNDNRRYPHETILQFLRRSLDASPERVALFGSWSSFQSIPASRDGDVFTNAGFQAYGSDDAAVRAISAMQRETPPPWNGSRYDVFTFRLAMAHLARHRPLVQWIGLNDTDDWAHQRQYVRVIEHLNRVDGWLRELWTWLQAQDDYRDRTALVLVTDHGRGNTATDWNGHGADVVGAENVWAAFAVPGWQRRGEWRDHAPLSQSQIAATLAAMLGFDWRTASPRAGAPIEP
jgi:hypothetical protein